MITINNLKFADNFVDLKMHPEMYYGVCRRYKNKLELYTAKNEALAAINRYGVLIGFTKTDDKKSYRFLFSDDPIYRLLHGPSFGDDLSRIYRSKHEHYINTIPDGGMFEAYPDHEYTFR